MAPSPWLYFYNRISTQAPLNDGAVKRVLVAAWVELDHGNIDDWLGLRRWWVRGEVC